MDEPRQLTEAEYMAMLPARVAEIAAEITALLPEPVRAAGLHFEYVIDEAEMIDEVLGDLGNWKPTGLVPPEADAR